MKHPSNRAFFAYWDGCRRGHASAPDCSDIEPLRAARALLGDIFVLSYDHDGGHLFASPAPAFARSPAAT